MSTAAITLVPASRWQRAVRFVTLPLVLIAFWQIWAATLPATSPAPAPVKVFQTAIDLVLTGGLLNATVQSLGRVATGFAVALVLGVAIGMLMGYSRAVRENLDPIVESSGRSRRWRCCRWPSSGSAPERRRQWPS